MKNSLLKSVVFAIAFFNLMIFADISVRAQTARPDPEQCVAGFCLGENEDTAKAMLQTYSPRYDNERHQPKYFFYNEYGNQVMSITAR
jgi:hypothetical protein